MKNQQIHELLIQFVNYVTEDAFQVTLKEVC
jgi:hypothetical protein